MGVHRTLIGLLPVQPREDTLRGLDRAMDIASNWTRQTA
jgi:hypothetical protein